MKANELARKDLIRAESRIAERHKKMSQVSGTVGSLISQLQAFDSNLPVVFTGNSDYANAFNSVESVTMPNTYNQQTGDFESSPQEVVEIKFNEESGWSF